MLVAPAIMCLVADQLHNSSTRWCATSCMSLFAGVRLRLCRFRVLIHAAAGGVGLAALQLAVSAGAEVLVTAGSARKRAALRSLGASHAACSRGVSFVTDLAQACFCGPAQVHDKSCPSSPSCLMLVPTQN